MTQKTQFNPTSMPATVLDLIQGQLDILTITTPSTPGTELAIKHGLGHIPQGWVILSMPYSWMNHGTGSTDWTDTFLYLKFSLPSTEIVIGVY